MKIKLIAYCLLMSSALQGMEDAPIQKYNSVERAITALFEEKKIAINVFAEQGDMYLTSKKAIENIMNSLPMTRIGRHGNLFPNIDSMCLQQCTNSENPIQQLKVETFSCYPKLWTVATSLNESNSLHNNYLTIYNIPNDKISTELHIECIKDFAAQKGDTSFIINIDSQLAQLFPLIQAIIDCLKGNILIFDDRLIPRFELANQQIKLYQRCFITLPEDTAEALFEKSYTTMQTMSSRHAAENSDYLNALLFCDSPTIFTYNKKDTRLNAIYTCQGLETIQDASNNNLPYSLAVFTIMTADNITEYGYKPFLTKLKELNIPIVIVMPKTINEEELAKINSQLNDLGFANEDGNIWVEGQPNYIKATKRTEIKTFNISGETSADEFITMLGQSKKTGSNKWYLVGGLAFAFFGFLYYCKFVAK